jgi:hypoxanthine phosphoribosyltransferase
MSTRVFDYQAAWLMTPTQASAAAVMLADAAARHFGPLSQVIAIARGGTDPATVIARWLGVPLLTVQARHNPVSDLYVQATGHVTCQLDDLRPGDVNGRALVVDDICGTGATLSAVTAALAQVAGPGTSLHTAALCRNAGAATRPDLIIWDNLRDWVIFPWEPGPPPGTATRHLPASTRVMHA